MCLPAAAAIPLAIASAVVTAGGQAVGAMNAASSYRYQAKLSDRNAQLESDAAHEAEQNNRIEQVRLGRKIGQTQGAQTAAMAANGVDLGFGNALSMSEDTAMLGAEDYGQLHRQGYQDRVGYDINISNYRADASAKRSAAKGAIVKGIFDVASTALGGASQVSGMKAKAKAGG